MFVVFALAVYTLLLLPYTILKLKGSGKVVEEDVSKPWEVRVEEGRRGGWAGELARCFFFFFFRVARALAGGARALRPHARLGSHPTRAPAFGGIGHSAWPPGGGRV
jgi:hypothetical protein